MALRKKKKTVLDRRLREINHEMTRLNSEVKAVSHSGVPRKLNTGFPMQRSDLQSQPSDSAQAGLDPAAADTSSEGAGKSTIDSVVGKPIPKVDDKARQQQQGYFDRGVKHQHQHVREKFASYFMTGHFQNLRPLRQDSRIIRNKAIMMVILVILAAIWVFYFLGQH